MTQIPKTSNDAPTVWPTGRTWNKLATTVNAQTPSMVPSQYRQSVQSVMIQNDAGADLNAHTVVGIGAPVTVPGEEISDDGYQNYHIFKSTQTDDETVKYAILKEGLTADLGGGVAQAGEAVVSGIATAVVNVTSASHEYVELGSSTYTLQTTNTETPILLLYAPGTGSQTCKVLIRGGGGGGDEFRRVTCQNDILPGTTETCDIQGGDGGQIEVVFDWIDEEQISAGKEIIVGRFGYEETADEIWRPISAECEDPPEDIVDHGDQTDPP